MRAFLVVLVIDQAVIGRLLPQHGPCLAVQRHYQQLVDLVSRRGIRMPERLTAQRVGGRRDAGNGLAFHFRCQENAVAPHHRRRVAAPGELGLPLNVRLGSPFRGQVLLFGNPVGERSPPSWPVRIGGNKSQSEKDWAEHCALV